MHTRHLTDHSSFHHMNQLDATLDLTEVKLQIIAAKKKEKEKRKSVLSSTFAAELPVTTSGDDKSLGELPNEAQFEVRDDE